MKRNKIRTLYKMLGLVKPLSGRMFLAVYSGTLAYLAVQFIPVLGAMGLLKIIGFNISLSLNTIFVLLVIFALSRAVLRYVEQKTNHYIAFSILAIVRDKVFKALRKLSPAKLSGKDKGDLISLITSDVELLEVFYAHTISPIFIAFTVETVMVIYISSYSRILGIIAILGFITIGILVPVIISRLSKDTGELVRQQSATLSSYVLENIRGLNETIQYDYYQKRLDGMDNHTERLTSLKEKMNDLSGYNIGIANSIIIAYDLLMLVVGYHLYQSGSIGFDAYVICQIAFMSSFGPVSALSALGSTLQNTIASCDRVLDVLEESPITKDITDGKDIVIDKTEINDLSFAYKDIEVLKDINMSFSKDQIVGILGKSGSGKSTLLKLLMRFWKTDNGSIRFNDIDIEDINTSSLRDNESYMTQESELFKDTIMNNVRIARLDASDQEVIEACKKASIHDFIMSLPSGYESQVGELGDTLSGGEKQRLSLARVFLHDAPLILLDEPTSNLDSLNEAIILKSLNDERKDKCIVLVSHRPSTIRIADKTYSVEDGRMS